MADNITSIKDPTISVKSTPKLVHYLKEHEKNISNFKQKAPNNIKKIITEKNVLLKLTDILWLDSFLKHNNKNVNLLETEELDIEIENFLNSKTNTKSDLIVKNVYLHELLDVSQLILPRNEVVERNPVLEARIKILQKEQEEREYKAMTRNVDMTKKFAVEDTLAYQMNMMNRHLIAVGQFLLSVAAGFAFGFLGVELIIGDLEFGFRLLLGIICALIVALAEFYFLAKHLVLEDELEDQQLSGGAVPPSFKFSTAVNGEKPHKD